MTKQEYAELRRRPERQKKRLEIMEHANWRCQICGGKDNTLHCHHSYYTKGKKPWQYPDGSIICICDGCHEKIHGKRKAAAAPEPERNEPPRHKFGSLTEAVRKAMDEPRPDEPPPFVPDPEAKSKRAALRAAVNALQDQETSRT